MGSLAHLGQITYEKITLRNKLGKNCDMNALERTTSRACPGWILYVCVVVMATICAPGQAGHKTAIVCTVEMPTTVALGQTGHMTGFVFRSLGVPWGRQG